MGIFEDITAIQNIIYIVASILFISGIKMLGKEDTAVKGNFFSAFAMFIAVLVTIIFIVDPVILLGGILLGAIIGSTIALKVKMTSIPEMVALFNGFGGLATFLIAWSEYNSIPDNYFQYLLVMVTIYIGGVTFTGSLIAYGKLSEKLKVAKTSVVTKIFTTIFYGSILFLIFCIVIGIILAIFLDQKIRAEGVLRTIYLYPMALSFIVTGTAWKWILNPTLGIQKMFIDWGFENFTFDWLVNREMAIYTIVIAGVWQSAGFVMALFLAGLRSVEDEIVKAAKIDGAGLFTVYWRILLPMMRPVFFTSFVILVHISIKSYDLIVALTQGGPGISTTMPALFMTQAAFHKSQVGISAASAMMMFMAVAAVIIPYLYSELRRENAR